MRGSRRAAILLMGQGRHGGRRLVGLGAAPGRYQRDRVAAGVVDQDVDCPERAGCVPQEIIGDAGDQQVTGEAGHVAGVGAWFRPPGGAWSWPLTG